jgi:hypothetical protein
MNYETLIYEKINTKCDITMKKIVDKIIRTGKMSRQDHVAITAVINDGEISETERRQINRVFDYIQTGQLKLVDW